MWCLWCLGVVKFYDIMNEYYFIPNVFYVFHHFSDFNIKVVEVQNSSHKLLKGHEAPILCVAMDQNEEFLVRKYNAINYVTLWWFFTPMAMNFLTLLFKCFIVYCASGIIQLWWHCKNLELERTGTPYIPISLTA